MVSLLLTRGGVPLLQVTIKQFEESLVGFLTGMVSQLLMQRAVRLLQVTIKQFEESLVATESAFKEAQAEGKALARQTLDSEKALHAATEDIQAGLSEQRLALDTINQIL